MKVFYRTVLNPSIILDGESMKVDELQLPDRILRTLHADLKTSTSVLPSSARKVQDWDLGLLERWSAPNNDQLDGKFTTERTMHDSFTSELVVDL